MCLLTRWFFSQKGRISSEDLFWKAAMAIKVALPGFGRIGSVQAAAYPKVAAIEPAAV